MWKEKTTADREAVPCSGIHAEVWDDTNMLIFHTCLCDILGAVVSFSLCEQMGGKLVIIDKILLFCLESDSIYIFKRLGY